MPRKPNYTHNKSVLRALVSMFTAPFFLIIRDKKTDKPVASIPLNRDEPEYVAKVRKGMEENLDVDKYYINHKVEKRDDDE